MKTEQQIIELAKLDGFEDIRISGPFNTLGGSIVINEKRDWHRLPSYLTSRDAIIPLVEKVLERGEMERLFARELHKLVFKFPLNWGDVQSVVDSLRMFLYTTPAQLCEALLRATGKWVD